MSKSVAIKEIINEIKNQISLAEDQLGSAYTLSHPISDTAFLINPQIMQDSTGYIPKMSGQITIKTEMDLKFKVKSIGYSLKHTLVNTLDFQYHYDNKGIDFKLANNEDGSVSSVNSLILNGNADIHDAKKQIIAVVENKQLRFLDQSTLALLEAEMPMECSSSSALKEFKRLVTTPNVKTPLKKALDNKFKKLCEQTI